MQRIHIYAFLLLTFVMNVAMAQQPSKKILVLGDSLSAGYGIDIQQGWVKLMQKELAQTHEVNIINASVSGETSSGGKARLPALLDEHKPDIVILELGGNDGLRGQPLRLLESNLQTMIDASKNAGAKVILAGMQIPPNYGPRYSSEFKALYEKLAQKNQSGLIPFLLEGIGGKAELMQRDGIHPTAEAQKIIMENALPEIKKYLADTGSSE